jgi:hypothetical protein
MEAKVMYIHYPLSAILPLTVANSNSSDSSQTCQQISPVFITSTSMHRDILHDIYLQEHLLQDLTFL